MTVLLATLSGLLAVVLLLDAPHLGFAGDDWNHIFSFMTEEQGLWANFTASWQHYLNLDRPTPMQPLILAILFQLFGDAPLGYFACGIIALAVGGFLMGRLVYRLSDSWLAAVASVLFWVGIPLHTQSLYMLSAGLGKWQGAIYFIASLTCYLNYLEHGHRRWVWLGLSALGYGLAMGCYEQAITFVSAYPLAHLLWIRQRTWKGVLLGGFWLHVVTAALYAWVRAGLLQASHLGGYHILGLGEVFSWETWNKLGYVGRFYAKVGVALGNLGVLFTAAGAASVLGVCVMGWWLGIRSGNGQRVPGTRWQQLHLLLLGICVFLSGHGIYLLISTGIDERSLVFPSIGMAIALASLIGLLHLATVRSNNPSTRKRLETAILVGIAVTGTLQLCETRRSSKPYQAAGRITQTVFHEVQRHADQIPKGAEVVILGTPWLADNTTWVFTANYSISGCVMRARRLPLRDSNGEMYLAGFMSILPEMDTYDCRLRIRNYPLGGYCLNYYTKEDYLNSKDDHMHGPRPQPYERLCLFLFDGEQLHRVSRFSFEDAEAKWHTKTLATGGVEYRQPRLATLVSSSAARPGQARPDLSCGPVRLLGFDLAKVPNLWETYKVGLAWERLVDGRFPGFITVFVNFQDDGGRILFHYAFDLNQEELDRQLERRTWDPDMVLQQNLLLTRPTQDSTADLLQRATKIEFVLQSWSQPGTAQDVVTRSTLPNPFRHQG